MEILIKLDKRLYKNAKHHTLTSGEIDEICDSIANCTSLPKGHGRLIDADKLKTHFIGTEQGTDLEVYLEPTVIEAPTIIEADKEG